MMATTSDDIEYVTLDVGGSVAHMTSRTLTDAPRVSSGPPGRGSDSEPRMIGDFGSSAKALWRLYETETGGPDKAHIKTLKDDMERILTFTGLFAVVLTEFIIEGKKGLKADPQDEMTYYLKQNVAMLDQISRQISFIAPQFSIPSTPPAPFPDFKTSASDIRVNVYWFMALVSSLSAAFLATLVQQSVRDYMDVFQRYSDPLKSARLRQYLYEGLERWCMPIIEAIPGILHVSLFLFFIGLCDFLFNINTTIGLTTTIPIVVTGSLYIAATIAQVISPQSPYRTSFSGIIWHAFQKLIARQLKIRGPDGAWELVSSNIARRQMQLAMEETDDRSRRDSRAIRRLVSKMTDDAEIESLVMAIPGSFSDGWGLTVWENILSSGARNENTSQYELKSRTASDSRPNTTMSTHALYPPGIHSYATTSHVRTGDTMQGLTVRVAHLLDTCKDRRLFATEDLWRRRTRACIETSALLVCGVGAELGQFGDAEMLKLLADIGDIQTVRESSSAGKDHSFVMRWTCFSLVAIRPILESTRILHNDARRASLGLERSDTGETCLEKIIQAFNDASSCLESFAGLLVLGEAEHQVEQVLSEHYDQISRLEQIDIEDAELQLVDELISTVQYSVDQITHGIITHQLPGVKSDISEKSNDINQFVELYRDPNTLLFISPLRNLRRIRSFAQIIREFLQEPDVYTLQEFQKTIKDLGEIEFPLQSDHLFRRQSWRLLDLQDGGLGFIVELFFLALKQLLSKSSSKEPQSALYISTFRAITSDWNKHKESLGTQKLLLNMVVPYQGIIFGFNYPPNIVTAFLKFLGNILKGQRGKYINDIAEQLDNATRDAIDPRHRALSTEALRHSFHPVAQLSS